MATKSAQMDIYLRTIANAVKGRDMRAALHDAIELAYNDAWDWYDATLGNATEALSKATQALQITQGYQSDIAEVEALATQLSEEYDTIAGRIDNIIAHNQDTEGNTELIDIRTNYQGYTAGSAGEAVRQQVRALSGRMDSWVITAPSTVTNADLAAVPEYTTEWTNSDMTASFAEQQITLSDYDFDEASEIVIEYYVNTESYSIPGSHPMYARVPLPDTTLATPETILADTYQGDYGVDHSYRGVELSKSGTSLVISFSDAIWIDTLNPFSLKSSDLTVYDLSASTSIRNSHMIPYKIYTLKWAVKGQVQVAKDTEIIDARTGVDGTVYNTIGEAIRSQIAQYSAVGVMAALDASY